MKRALLRIVEYLAVPLSPFWTGLVGSYFLAWGIWVVAPWRITREEGVWRILYLLPEPWWGLVGVAAGALILFGSCRKDSKPVYYGMALASLLWGFVACTFLISAWTQPGWITYGWYSLTATLMWINLTVNRVSGMPSWWRS